MTTAGVLAGIGSLHAAWAAGSAFPMKDRRELSQVVAGIDVMPTPPQCLAVAGALGVASALVADIGPVPPGLRKLGVTTASGVLAVRGACGIAGQTKRLVPWTPSQRFVELDRKYFGPLCLMLATGAANALRSARGSRG